ncbi:hypothetical protein PPERSA_00283 [Pseudocohnilembus persalinus]|uniref:Tetratricopeptide repeat protein n=1 Tax=Pseudocohnilembus persalinus TaxID=266149 RepID=A0A0V0Q9H5_PSEPJ|nr:hypothetical protein PPERSA_00283 [Pseudocohnilembus persalinus]|eukprot:KRW98695.1 hypothetical protein PPERSA_00283 [Pseudocohnilembus persalinus]
MIQKRLCYYSRLIQATQGEFFNPEKALETYEKLIYLSQLEGGPYYDLEADAKRIKGQVLIEKKQFKKGINVLFEALQIYYEMGLQFTQQFMEVYQYLEDVSFNFRSLTQEQKQIIQECQQIYQSLKKGNAA